MNGEIKMAFKDRKLAKYFFIRQPWEITRQKGRDLYIFRTGVLLCGGPFFIISTCIDFFSYRNTGLFLFNVVFSFFIYCPLIGWLMGLWFWHTNEKRYLKMRENGSIKSGHSAE
jgi:hypothetical protein